MLGKYVPPLALLGVVLSIVVGRWGETELAAENLALLRAEGIEQVGTTLRASRDQVMQVSQRLATLAPQAAPSVA